MYNAYVNIQRLRVLAYALGRVKIIQLQSSRSVIRACH